MPILPIAPLPPPLPQAAPAAVPLAQRVTPVEPAKAVTRNKESGQAGLDPDQEKRRRKQDQKQDEERGRGGLYDLEV
jgi:hypothetical protein